MRSYIYTMDMSNFESIRRKYLKTNHLPFTCMYCGEPANEKEHVYPRSLVGEDTPKVWACSECNNLAGAILFETIEEKRNYIQDRLRVKYRKLISLPVWTDKEISEVKGNIKREVKKQMEAKRWIQKRIEWKESPVALCVTKALQESDTGSSFALTNAELNTTQKREARLLLRCESKEQELAL